MHSLLSNSWLRNYWTFQCLKMRTLVWNLNYTSAKTSQFADLLLIMLAKRSTSHVHANTALRSCSSRTSPVSKYGVHLMVAASVLREFLSKIMYSWSWFTFLFWSLRKYSQRVRHDPVAPASRWASHMQCLPMQRNYWLSNATDCHHTPELCLYKHWAAGVKEMRRQCWSLWHSLVTMKGHNAGSFVLNTKKQQPALGPCWVSLSPNPHPQCC
jgi:hypothetical protein